jgi:hypothetical protein
LTPLPPEYREQFFETDGLGLVNTGGDPLMIFWRGCFLAGPTRS